MLIRAREARTVEQRGQVTKTISEGTRAKKDLLLSVMIVLAVIGLIAGFDLVAVLQGWIAPDQLNLFLMILLVLAIGTIFFAAKQWVDLHREVSRRKAIESALQQSETRYRQLFFDSPVPLWLDDYSGPKKMLDSLVQSGIADLRTYLKEHREFLLELIKGIQVLQVNQSLERLHEIRGAEEYQARIPLFFTDDTYEVLIDQLLALWNNELPFEAETVICLLPGEERTVLLRCSFVPGHEANWSMVLLSAVDVTEHRRAERAILESRDLLEQRVQERTTALTESNRALKEEITCREQTEEELQQKTRQLRALARELVNAQEKERRWIARELHDDIGQSLTALQLLIQQGCPPDSSIPPHLARAQQLSGELLATVRSISLELRPSMLDDLGLRPALEWQAARFAQTTGIEVHLDLSNVDRRFSNEVETAAFRIVQESLTNIARHARTEEAWVFLHETLNYLEIRVDDRGVGIARTPERVKQPSIGINGMEERALALGGTFQLESRPGQGTLLQVSLPLRGEREMEDGR